jgi:hypothetical protein
MTTPAQIDANRANATHSTGPRTPEGKARSAANSLKQGFHSSTLVIPEELRAEFDAYRAALLKTTQPANVIEADYFRRLLLNGWNLRRVHDAETQALLQTEPDNHRLELLAHYRRDLERSYDRTLKTLRELQTERAQRLAAPAELREALAVQAPLAKPPIIPGLTDMDMDMNAIVDTLVPPSENPKILARLLARNAREVA